MDTKPTLPDSAKAPRHVFEAAVDMVLSLVDYAYDPAHETYASDSITTASDVRYAEQIAVAHADINTRATTMLQLRRDLQNAGILQRSYEDMIRIRSEQLRHYPWVDIRSIIGGYMGSHPAAQYLLLAVDAMQSASNRINMIQPVPSQHSTQLHP